MSNIKNFIDEKATKKIIDFICALDFPDVHKLAENSGIPLQRLQRFIEGDEKMTRLDKGKLIIHLINLEDITIEGLEDDDDQEKFRTLHEFQLRKTG